MPIYLVRVYVDRSEHYRVEAANPEEAAAKVLEEWPIPMPPIVDPDATIVRLADQDETLKMQIGEIDEIEA
jgi:hypothetical protein